MANLIVAQVGSQGILLCALLCLCCCAVLRSMTWLVSRVVCGGTACMLHCCAALCLARPVQALGLFDQAASAAACSACSALRCAAGYNAQHCAAPRCSTPKRTLRTRRLGVSSRMPPPAINCSCGHSLYPSHPPTHPLTVFPCRLPAAAVPGLCGRTQGLHPLHQLPRRLRDGRCVLEVYSRLLGVLPGVPLLPLPRPVLAALCCFQTSLLPLPALPLRPQAWH